MVLVVKEGITIIKNLQDKTVFTRQKTSFLTQNQQKKDISEEGAQQKTQMEIDNQVPEVVSLT